MKEDVIEGFLPVPIEADWDKDTVSVEDEERYNRLAVNNARIIKEKLFDEKKKKVLFIKLVGC